MMRQKILIVMSVALLVGTIFALGTLKVSAQEPSNTYPGAAQYIDGQWRSIGGNTSLWYIFEYSGDRSEISLLLVDGYVNRVDFNVFTPEQVRVPDTINGTPIGRGSSPNNANCGGTRCSSNDLVWSSKMNIAGKYYVQVTNREANAKPFQLKVSGTGVFVLEPTSTPTLRAPAAATSTRTRTPSPGAPAISPVAVWTSMAIFSARMKASDAGTPAPTVQPPSDGIVTPPTSTPTASASAVTTPTRLPAAEFLDANNFYPQSATYVLDGRERIVPGNSSLWFKFDYAGDGSLAVVRIPEGSLRKLAFKIYEGNAISQLGLDAPAMGQGSVPLVNCGGVRCPSGDLEWSSKFPGPGTVYVQVINNNPGQINFSLVVSGPGVILGK
ncbi:MAG: hypothetical protein HY327_14090 [Chloroflexi bacterium]|nr:hypothetical protein [Chloroflexota bacterium]